MTEQVIVHTEKSVFSRIAEYLKYANEMAKLKRQIRQERNQLVQLTESELKDLGITRHDALQEANRDFDDVPKHRVRSWFFCR